MSYLRQLTQQAGGQRLPGQPRPMRQADAARSPGHSPDERIEESGLESALEETVVRERDLNRLTASTMVPERLQAAAPQIAASTLTAKGSSSLPTTHGLEPAVDPVAIRRSDDRTPITTATRFDSLEALLPAILNPRGAFPESASLESATQRSAADNGHDARDPAPEHRRDSSVTARAPSPKSTRPESTRRGEPNPITPAPAVPDVHIHIGRVELTALQPPAPRPPPRREEKKPMSLEEYLRQRDGRRS